MDITNAAGAEQFLGATQPQPLGGDAIQSLLDDETVLLEYAVGERRSYVWAVTRAGIASYELSPSSSCWW